MKKIAIFLTGIALLSMMGCTNLTRTEKEVYSELQGYGIKADDQQAKSPVAAAALNLLPGVGNFYLAAGTEQSEQWAFGAINLLFWPLSVVWGIPEAGIDAGVINKKETVNYYMYDPNGKKQLAKLRAQNKKHTA